MSLSGRCSDCVKCAKCFGGLLSRVASGGASRAAAASDVFRGSELVKLDRGFSPRSGKKRNRSYNELSSSSPVSEERSVGEDTIKAVEYQHLVVMLHGLYGAPENWDVVRSKLQERLEGEGDNVLLYASGVNKKGNSLVGIDVCSERLSEELAIILKRHPSLRKISFLCHSMGALIARHASGVNFDPQTRTIYRLEPRHFISIASPHLGCHTDGESQVPMIGWGRNIPILGGTVFKTVFRVATNPLMGVVYRNTGKHLFMTDGGESQEPLVLKLVQDRPGEGWFFSALAQFRTRVCYANTYGDAMVGWANASLRRRSELPIKHYKNHKGSGVILEDALDRGVSRWVPETCSSCDRSETLSEEETDVDSLTTEGDLEIEINDRGPAPPNIAGTRNQQETSPMVTCESFNSVREVVDLRDRQALVEYMLSRLQSLPWCRIDVSFKRRSVPFCAHTHIQVTRKWIDFVGMSVADHISQRFVELERFVEGSS
ncbi:hypothetical protein BSKO_01462 [Bryopsis sp. KO-2023]|nr:hypothetical protein BSKO_01462 [Bryopsis sp. KO-2023]